MKNTGLEVEYVSCNLCGLDRWERWGEKDGIQIVECLNCGLIYANPRLTREGLIEYYSKQYFEEGNYLEDIKRQKMYEYEIKRMLPVVGTTGRFLDVGCAMGKFLYTLPDTFEKYGVEFSSEAAESARNKFGLNVKYGQISEVEIEGGFYDIVQMRGVIEHLQDPKKDVLCVNKALKREGWFILHQTPNIGGLSGRIYKERFNQVFPREHLYYFSVRTIKELLKKCGFKVEKIYFPYFKTPYASPAKDFISFFLNYFKGKESPPFYGNMMAVYSRKVGSTNDCKGK